MLTREEVIITGNCPTPNMPCQCCIYAKGEYCTVQVNKVDEKTEDIKPKKKAENKEVKPKKTTKKSAIVSKKK